MLAEFGMVRLSEVKRLACPTCQGSLTFQGSERAGELYEGRLECGKCKPWPVEEGLCRLYREEAVRGNDRLLRYFYDGLPSLHDAAVRYTLPVFQAGTEQQVRDGYMPRLELAALKPRPDGQPVRILEVGIGTGANLAWVRRDLPPGLPVEIWGVDLSQGMLNVLRQRLPQWGQSGPCLLMADAHALPFPAASFDRVFHTGAIGNYRAPAVALAEMARVAIPGTPIVVVDEQLDSSRRQGLYHRLMFRLVTFYDRHPHAPVEHLPAGAVDVRVEQISRFFYCLSFRMPEGPGVAR